MNIKDQSRELHFCSLPTNPGSFPFNVQHFIISSEENVTGDKKTNKLKPEVYFDWNNYK